MDRRSVGYLGKAPGGGVDVGFLATVRGRLRGEQPLRLERRREPTAVGCRQRAHPIDDVALHPPRLPGRVGDLHPTAEVAVLLGHPLACRVDTLDDPSGGIARRHPAIVVDVDGDLAAELVELEADPVAVGELRADDALLVVEQHGGRRPVGGDDPRRQAGGVVVDRRGGAVGIDARDEPPGRRVADLAASTSSVDDGEDATGVVTLVADDASVGMVDGDDGPGRADVVSGGRTDAVGRRGDRPIGPDVDDIDDTVGVDDA